MQYAGLNGQIEVVGDALIIRRTGMVARMGGTAGPDRRIPLPAISGVGFKDTTRLVNGHIQLGLGGRPIRELGSQATGDPDTVVFTHKARDQFHQLHKWLQSVVELNLRAGIDPSAVAYDQGESRLDRLEQKRQQLDDRLEQKKQELDEKDQHHRAHQAERMTGPDGRRDVQDAVARMGWKLGGGREIKNLGAHLYDTETVQLIAQGTYSDDQGIIVLTDTRLLFLFHGIVRQRKEDFPLRSISSVQSKTGMITGELQIFSSGNTAKISGVVKDDLEKIAEAIRQQIAHGSPSPPATTAASAPDITDQLRKLAELYEAGILTEAEFTAKKQELLGRL
ncbi:PH domain-containing protein [Nocardia salmonicida]|uniref:PH domain-containing protein n=1 Tax=Nocardia salmonicida TaxID=53431 RepID=UPI0007A4EED5|nr:PH domain-containing protein [Nocardia salmonicida]